MSNPSKQEEMTADVVAIMSALKLPPSVAVSLKQLPAHHVKILRGRIEKALENAAYEQSMLEFAGSR